MKNNPETPALAHIPSELATWLFVTASPAFCAWAAALRADAPSNAKEMRGITSFLESAVAPNQAGAFSLDTWRPLVEMLRDDVVAAADTVGASGSPSARVALLSLAGIVRVAVDGATGLGFNQLARAATDAEAWQAEPQMPQLARRLAVRTAAVLLSCLRLDTVPVWAAETTAAAVVQTLLRVLRVRGAAPLSGSVLQDVVDALDSLGPVLKPQLRVDAAILAAVARRHAARLISGPHAGLHVRLLQLLARSNTDECLAYVLEMHRALLLDATWAAAAFELLPQLETAFANYRSVEELSPTSASDAAARPDPSLVWARLGLFAAARRVADSTALQALLPALEGALDIPGDAAVPPAAHALLWGKLVASLRRFADCGTASKAPAVESGELFAALPPKPLFAEIWVAMLSLAEPALQTAVKSRKMSALPVLENNTELCMLARRLFAAPDVPLHIALDGRLWGTLVLLIGPFAQLLRELLAGSLRQLSLHVRVTPLARSECLAAADLLMLLATATALAAAGEAGHKALSAPSALVSTLKQHQWGALVRHLLQIPDHVELPTPVDDGQPLSTWAAQRARALALAYERQLSGDVDFGVRPRADTVLLLASRAALAACGLSVSGRWDLPVPRADPSRDIDALESVFPGVSAEVVEALAAERPWAAFASPKKPASSRAGSPAVVARAFTVSTSPAQQSVGEETVAEMRPESPLKPPPGRLRNRTPTVQEPSILPRVQPLSDAAAERSVRIERQLEKIRGGERSQADDPVWQAAVAAFEHLGADASEETPVLIPETAKSLVESEPRSASPLERSFLKSPSSRKPSPLRRDDPKGTADEPIDPDDSGASSIAAIAAFGSFSAPDASAEEDAVDLDEALASLGGDPSCILRGPLRTQRLLSRLNALTLS